MVVVDPRGGAEALAGKRRGHLGETAAAVGEEAYAASGEHGEVGAAVVVEVAGHRGGDVRERVEARARDEPRAGGEQLQPAAAPGEEIGPLVAVGVEEGEARRLARAGLAAGEHDGPARRKVGRLGRRRRCRRTHAPRLDRVEQLRPAAPLRVLGHRRPRLRGLRAP